MGASAVTLGAAVVVPGRVAGFRVHHGDGRHDQVSRRTTRLLGLDLEDGFLGVEGVVVDEDALLVRAEGVVRNRRVEDVETAQLGRVVVVPGRQDFRRMSVLVFSRVGAASRFRRVLRQEVLEFVFHELAVGAVFFSQIKTLGLIKRLV